jgi:N-acetylmuramoyl-L-alanine amidase
MNKLYLVAGHGQGDPGAVGNGYKEADLTRRIAAALYNKLKGKIDVELYSTSMNLFQSKNYSVFKANSYVLEIHLNAATATANGVELLMKQGLAVDKVSNSIYNSLTGYFTARGIKQCNDLANMNYFASRGIGYSLLEVCFISNSNDVSNLINKFDEIVTSLANAILTASGKAMLPPISVSVPIKKGDFEGMNRKEIEEIIGELYFSVLTRKADVGGLKYWADLAQNGISFPAIFLSFAREREIVEKFVLEVLYKGLLKRKVDKIKKSEIDYWAGRILSKEITKDNAYNAVLKSEEYKKLKK